jgi:hypothetical protein
MRKRLMIAGEATGIAQLTHLGAELQGRALLFT